MYERVEMRNPTEDSKDMGKKIFGYYFRVVVEKGEDGYVAYAPGVGGIYEEGKTHKEAMANAYATACAILETRIESDDPIIDSNPDLKVLHDLPSRKHIEAIRGIPDGYIATPRCLVHA